jgi:hypothetical protein
MEEKNLELLHHESIASVKAIMDYAKERYKDLDYRDEVYKRWYAIEIECLYELESRIKQIFP